MEVTHLGSVRESYSADSNRQVKTLVAGALLGAVGGLVVGGAVGALIGGAKGSKCVVFAGPILGVCFAGLMGCIDKACPNSEERNYSELVELESQNPLETLRTIFVRFDDLNYEETTNLLEDLQLEDALLELFSQEPQALEEITSDLNLTQLFTVLEERLTALQEQLQLQNDLQRSLKDLIEEAIKKDKPLAGAA